MLLGVSGSVAAIKTKETVHQLRERASTHGLKAEVRELYTCIQSSIEIIYSLTIRLQCCAHASVFLLLIQVRVVTTFRGATFVPVDLDAAVVSDDSEWQCWRQRDDPIAHIEVTSGRVFLSCLLYPMCLENKFRVSQRVDPLVAEAI